MKPSPQKRRTTLASKLICRPQDFFDTVRKQIPVPACLLARNTPLKANRWNLKITHLPYLGFWVPPLHFGDCKPIRSSFPFRLTHFRTVGICYCGKKGSRCSPNLGSFPRKRGFQKFLSVLDMEHPPTMPHYLGSSTFQELILRECPTTVNIQHFEQLFHTLMTCIAWLYKPIQVSRYPMSSLPVCARCYINTSIIAPFFLYHPQV